VLLVRKTIVEKLGNLDNAQWFLTRKQIEAWMAKMRREGASASTANNVFALLSNMFTKAKDWGYISHDPTKGIEKFKDTVSRDRFLMPDEFQALMKELNSNAKRIIRAKLYTALRIRNLLDLTWIKWTSTER
jgi:site-specific recombinase XerD